MTLQELRDNFNSAQRNVILLRGAIRRLRPDVLAQHAKQHFDSLAEDNEAIRRLPKAERARILADITSEHSHLRQSAARVANFNVGRNVHAFITDARVVIENAKRDTSLSFAEAFDQVSSDGRIMLALLRNQLRTELPRVPVAELFERYQSAMARTDAVAFVEAEIIETLVKSDTHSLVTSETDRPIAKQLREFMEGVMAQRLPDDLPDIDALLRESDRLLARADILKVQPVDPARDSTASEAFDREEAELFRTGALSQADYMREASTGDEA